MCISTRSQISVQAGEGPKVGEHGVLSFFVANRQWSANRQGSPSANRLPWDLLASGPG
jgi:hypothetical protein